MFDNFGQTGWKFVSDQLLKGSLQDDISIINNTNTLKNIIKENEPNQTRIIERMKKFE